MSKENFIQKLKDITPEQLNRIIEEKGKEPKMLPAMWYIK